MGWNWLPDDPRQLQRMREAGFTIAGFARPEQLDACHEAGLQAIVFDPRCHGYDWLNVDPDQARANAESLVAQVKDHPAVYGYHLRDEPSAQWYPGLTTVADAFRELDPDRWPYINLFPNYATNAQLGAASYEEYLEEFVRICRPRFLSYDNYFFMRPGEEERRLFWLNLEQMRACSLRHNIPFWNIVLSLGAINYREPSAADIRLQAFASLAYGAVGLSWFMYFAAEVGNFRMAPVDQFGVETATWYPVQNVNRQLQQWAPIYSQLRSTDVYHLGSVPDGSRGPEDSSALLDDGKLNLLVGEFAHVDGSRYLIVVNKDMSADTYCELPFRHTPQRVEFVSPWRGTLQEFTGEHLFLAPGQAHLIKLL
jgi:hypothetical protein